MQLNTPCYTFQKAIVKIQHERGWLAPEGYPAQSDPLISVSVVLRSSDQVARLRFNIRLRLMGLQRNRTANSDATSGAVDEKRRDHAPTINNLCEEATAILRQMSTKPAGLVSTPFLSQRRLGGDPSSCQSGSDPIADIVSSVVRRAGDRTLPSQPAPDFPLHSAAVLGRASGKTIARTRPYIPRPHPYAIPWSQPECRGELSKGGSFGEDTTIQRMTAIHPFQSRRRLELR